MLDRDEYIVSLETEMEENSAYERTDYNMTEKSSQKMKKLVCKMNRDGLASDDLILISHRSMCRDEN